jgi:hypothetical protein
MDQGLDQTAQQDTSPEKNAAANAAPGFYHFSDVGVLFAIVSRGNQRGESFSLRSGRRGGPCQEPALVDTM